MNEKVAIETFGNITKEENIVSLENNIRKGTFVVEQLEAYPGYHHADPFGTEMGHIFLILESPIEVMDLMRLSKKVEKLFEKKFDAVVGQLIFDNKIYPCIRVKNLKNYQQIEELQMWFFDAGIRFAKGRKVKTTALIKLKKPFYIEEVAENIYHDLNDLKHWYLAVENEMPWTLFKKITQLVKNNLPELNFDAATTGIYRKYGFVDAVRIYTTETDIEKLQKIRDTYNMVCKKFV